jgi:hypothetical protein
MATRAPLREHERPLTEPSHRLFHRAEEWAEETSLAPEGESREGIPWHAVLLILVGLAILIGLEITLVLGLAKAFTGRAY